MVRLVQQQYYCNLCGQQAYEFYFFTNFTLRLLPCTFQLTM